MPCEPATLVDVALFEFLPEEDRQRLAEVLNVVTLREGDILFKAGEPGDSLFLVLSGGVGLTMKDTAGQKIELARVEKDGVFGELALLDGQPRTATAVAETETTLIELDRDDLLFLFQRKPDVALHLLAGMSAMTRRADELLQSRVARNPNEVVETQSTTLQRMADVIAAFSGSMSFLIINAIWFFAWIVANTLPMGIRQFDPFPFGLLTMIVSLEAIFLSCFVLISQSRQAEKDRIRSDIEYEVNVEAEKEIKTLHEKVDQINKNVVERFKRIERHLTAGQASPKY